MIKLAWPERLRLAHRPTPVELLPRLSQELGARIYVKRDDLTGAALSGNKVRKLEFLLAKALLMKATDVLTTGGVQSNHCRATAIACRKLGLQPHLLLRTADGTEPTHYEGNHFLDHLVGAKIRTLSLNEWPQRNDRLDQWASELKGAGKSPFIIPEGGSNLLGSLGYVALIDELKSQMVQLDPPTKSTPSNKVTYLVHACGSGGTTAGLAMGAALDWTEAGPTAFAVCDDETYFRKKVDAIAKDFMDTYRNLPGPKGLNYLVLDQYKGAGYALSTPEELRFIQEIAQQEGLILDPVYTGKAFLGMVSQLRARKTFRKGSTLVFIHTGGIYGLFPKSSEFSWGS